jgi:hypothetical protein
VQNDEQCYDNQCPSELKLTEMNRKLLLEFTENEDVKKLVRHVKCAFSFYFTIFHLLI